MFRVVTRAVGSGLLALAIGTAGLAMTADPAAAAAQPSHQSQHTPAWNPDDDYLGSTIRAHEGLRAFATPATTPSGPQGIDVSHFQGAVNWSLAAGSGVQFAYMKATEGTTFVDPQFSSNYSGSAAAGLLRGAYHFAHPDSSSGITQAQFFAANGGGWSASEIGRAHV